MFANFETFATHERSEAGLDCHKRFVQKMNSVISFKIDFHKFHCRKTNLQTIVAKVKRVKFMT